MSWTFDRAAYERRVERYVNARFGLFPHWGLYVPIDTVLEVEPDGP